MNDRTKQLEVNWIALDCNGVSSSLEARDTGWYERLQAECTADHGEYPEDGTLADRLRWWVPKSVRHGSTTLEDDLRDAADSLCAGSPQPDHYQQLLGVAYVVLGCLAANGVDIPERFLDAFSDPDSVENPLELLPCDFSPAQAVRAVVEAEDAARVTKLRELLRTKRVADEEIDAWLNPEVDRRSVWFMYDCHQFARPDVSNPEAAFKSARELFDEDGCGSIFVKRWKDGPAIRELELGADYKRNGYKVLDEEIRAWVERYFSWKPDAAQQESPC